MRNIRGSGCRGLLCSARRACGSITANKRNYGITASTSARSFARSVTLRFSAQSVDPNVVRFILVIPSSEQSIQTITLTRWVSQSFS